ncbi:MAG: YtxH domain-containing protein [Saprospiraceae bacterium]|nr:YtxH domain-containing protein [Saprospiraceae bacterium]
MKKSNVVFGIVAGAAVGALVGVLMAPDIGSRTRRKLYTKGEDVMDDLKDKVYILAAYANEVNNEIDRLSDKVDASIEHAAHEAVGKVGEAISKFGEGKKRGS